MKQWFSKLSPVMQIVVIVVAIIAVWFVLKIAKNYAGRLGQYAESVGESAALESQGVKKTYTQSQYNSMASQLYFAMKGIGTDEDVIYTVFGKMQNDLDVIALTNAYGVRDGYDLQGWLRGDLSSSEMGKVNTILANKGITKSF